MSQLGREAKMQYDNGSENSSDAGATTAQIQEPGARRTLVSMVGASGLRAVFNVVSGPILSRMVGPFAYGVIGPAQAVSGLGKLVADSGYSYHTLTAKNLSSAEARSLAEQNLRLSIGIGTLGAMVAFAIGDVPLWQRCVRALVACLAVALGGCAAVPIAWLQRNKRLAQVEWANTALQGIVTFGVAVPLALAKGGMAAVACNWLLPLAVTLGIALCWSGLLRVRRSVATIPRSYRASVFGLNVTSYLAVNADNLSLAMYLPTVTLGVYGRAFLLATMPAMLISTSLQKYAMVHLSQSSCAANDLRFLGKAAALMGLAYVPLFVPSLLGLDLPALFFGHGFAFSSTAFAMLVVSQWLFCSASLIHTYFNARRALRQPTVACALQAVLLLVGFVALRPNSFLQISAVVLAANVCAWFFIVAAAYLGFRRSQGSSGEHGRGCEEAPQASDSAQQQFATCAETEVKPYHE